jgi:hypothetical protein
MSVKEKSYSGLVRRDKWIAGATLTVSDYFSKEHDSFAKVFGEFIMPVICETPERKETLQKRLYELGPGEQ